MEIVYLLLGSNRGERNRYISDASAMISAEAGEIFIRSSLYETEPWGFTDPNPFLNRVVGIRTEIDPAPLLEHLLAIESRLGRTRPAETCGCATGNQYESRTIDIDILFYGARIIFTEKLMIPHPRLHERRFSLVPMNEIAPGFIHPVLKKSMAVLLQECTDRSGVSRVEEDNSINKTR